MEGEWGLEGEWGQVSHLDIYEVDIKKQDLTPNRPLWSKFTGELVSLWKSEKDYLSFLNHVKRSLRSLSE